MDSYTILFLKEVQADNRSFESVQEQYEIAIYEQDAFNGNRFNDKFLRKNLFSYSYI